MNRPPHWELGAGPLALLKLRDFKLPSPIFLSENDERRKTGGSDELARISETVEHGPEQGMLATDD